MYLWMAIHELHIFKILIASQLHPPRRSFIAALPRSVAVVTLRALTCPKVVAMATMAPKIVGGSEPVLVIIMYAADISSEGIPFATLVGAASRVVVGWGGLMRPQESLVGVANDARAKGMPSDTLGATALHAA